MKKAMTIATLISALAAAIAGSLYQFSGPPTPAVIEVTKE